MASLYCVAVMPENPIDMYDSHIRARMIDFFTLGGQLWTRRLWDVGSLLALEELLEACTWARHRVLSVGAVDWQRYELLKVIGPDLGLGDRDLRAELTALLKNPLSDPSPAHRRLREVVEHARGGYLTRWAAAAARPPEQRPRPERIARVVAAHLLDLGYDVSHLAGWMGELARRRATAEDVLQAAVTLDAAAPSEFTVLAVLDSAPDLKQAQKHEVWVSGREVVDWLRQRGHPTSGVRAAGGFVYRVVARDPFGAASQAREFVERMVARSSFIRSDGGVIRPASQLWVDQHAEPIPFATPARGADLRNLVNGGRLYQVEGPRTVIDDALELAAPVNHGALGPAVAGAWAAVESLLSHPDDPSEEERSGKAVAADRLAAIIACSWPRAELTTLAYRYRSDTSDSLADALATCTSSRERAFVMVEALTAGNGPEMADCFRGNSDIAAVHRMRRVVANPTGELATAVAVFRIAMRRLYRTRNIVLHGGSTQGVALKAALRIAAPLVGAGLNRITYGTLAEGLAPLNLAARAEVGLKLVGGETGLTVADLLEPRRQRPENLGKSKGPSQMARAFAI
ncbi:integrase [Actinoplanes sp. NPDC026619]|uniref:integrase n=1 Tax=Actinoplanes sp. NPDC026619 TaxID=3155798 RepID=UPI00340587F9